MTDKLLLPRRFITSSMRYAGPALSSVRTPKTGQEVKVRYGQSPPVQRSSRWPRSATHSPQFKAKVALDREQYTISLRTSIPFIPPRMEEAALRAPARAFQRPGSNAQSAEDAQMVPQLYQQIGRLQVELEWLKKKHESLGGSAGLCTCPSDGQAV